MKTLLVTTADETTWEKIKQFILGDWCKNNIENIFGKILDYKTVKPYGNSRN